jgi:hypothetical protein
MLKNEISHEKALAFLLAGKCYFILFTTNPLKAALDHLSYQIYGKPSSGWSVYYQGHQIGAIMITSTAYTFDKMHTIHIDATRLALAQRSIAYMMYQLQKETLPDHFHILHQGRCGKCARPLTDPVSIELGLGPVCGGRI